MARVLYARVSSVQQNLDRQLIDSDQYRRVFCDKMSGKDRNRPQLEECIGYVREGDIVEVAEISRLARSVSDMLSIVADINREGASVHFIKENLTFSPEASDAMAKFQLHIFSAVAELERSLIRERQLEGIKLAKEAGKFKGGQKKLTAEQEAEIVQFLKDGVSVIELADTYKVSRQTVYNIKKANA